MLARVYVVLHADCWAAENPNPPCRVGPQVLCSILRMPPALFVAFLCLVGAAAQGRLYKHTVGDKLFALMGEDFLDKQPEPRYTWDELVSLQDVGYATDVDSCLGYIPTKEEQARLDEVEFKRETTWKPQGFYAKYFPGVTPHDDATSTESAKAELYKVEGKPGNVRVIYADAPVKTGPKDRKSVFIGGLSDGATCDTDNPFRVGGGNEKILEWYPLLSINTKQYAVYPVSESLFYSTRCRCTKVSAAGHGKPGNPTSPT